MTDIQDRTRLHGRWLSVVRLAWVAAALFFTGLFLATLPDRLSQPAELHFLSDWTDEEVDAALADLGWSRLALHQFETGVNLVLGFLSIALSWFLFWRRSDDWMSLCTAALFIWMASSGSFEFLIPHHPAWATVALIGNCLSSAMLITFFFIFPDGRFVPRWTRWAALAVTGIQTWRLFNEPAYDALAPFLMAPLFLPMVIAPVYRYLRAASPGQRQQIKWVVFGLAASLIPLVVYLFFFLSFPGLSRPGAPGLVFNLVGNFLWLGFLVTLPVSFVIAILRSRLWDIDVLIRKTLVWGAITVLLGLVYFGGVTLLQSVFSAFSKNLNFVQAQSPISIVLSTLAIAALFNPLRRRVQEFVDQRFYRRKYDAEQALASFAALSRQEVDLEQISTHLLAVVEETVQPESMSLWLRPTADRDPTKWGIRPASEGRAR